MINEGHMKQLLLVLMLAGMLVGCTSDETPSATYELGEVIYTNTFDDPTSWETFGVLETQFGITDGVFNAISDGGGYIPVTNGVNHSNVVMEATVTLAAGSDNSVYGIMCRSQSANNNVGYYFLLSGSGQVGIRIGDGSSVRIFTPWIDHPAVKKGLNTNTLRAVCIDDYFAFCVNDRFVPESRQDWLTQGSMGFTVATPSGEPIAAQFDDVTIWDASLITDSE